MQFAVNIVQVGSKASKALCYETANLVRCLLSGTAGEQCGASASTVIHLSAMWDCDCALSKKGGVLGRALARFSARALFHVLPGF